MESTMVEQEGRPDVPVPLDGLSVEELRRLRAEIEGGVPTLGWEWG